MYLVVAKYVCFSLLQRDREYWLRSSPYAATNSIYIYIYIYRERERESNYWQIVDHKQSGKWIECMLFLDRVCARCPLKP